MPNEQTRTLQLLLDLDDRQLGILQTKWNKTVIAKAINNTVKTVGKQDVLRRRTYFKECLKHYQKLNSLPDTPKFTDSPTIDPEVFTRLKDQFKDKPWSRKH